MEPAGHTATHTLTVQADKQPDGPTRDETPQTFAVTATARVCGTKLWFDFNDPDGIPIVSVELCDVTIAPIRLARRTVLNLHTPQWRIRLGGLKARDIEAIRRLWA